MVTVTLSGDFGKPRPAVVIQSDQFAEAESVTLLLISGALVDVPLFRLSLQPTEANGLRKPSQVMVDKALTVRRERVGPVIGHIDAETMLEITRSLAVFLGFA